MKRTPEMALRPIKQHLGLLRNPFDVGAHLRLFGLQKLPFRLRPTSADALAVTDNRICRERLSQTSRPPRNPPKISVTGCTPSMRARRRRRLDLGGAELLAMRCQARAVRPLAPPAARAPACPAACRSPDPRGTSCAPKRSWRRSR